MAIANSKNNMSSINLYNIDQHNYLIDPTPFKVIHYQDAVFRGVQLSSNSQYMVGCTMDDSGLILIYKLNYETNGAKTITLSKVVQNRYAPLKPKSVDFSSDGTLMIVCYSANGGDTSRNYDALAIYAFDNNTVTINKQPMCELNGNPELSFNDANSFSHDALSSFIKFQSQSNDTVIFYNFDNKIIRLIHNS